MSEEIGRYTTNHINTEINSKFLYKKRLISPKL